MIRDFIESVGKYCLFLKMVFRKPEKWSIFWRQFIGESEKLILSSVLLVCVISLFIGGVLVIQIASNIENPFIDRMNVGYMLREILILEFCSTIVALILAGKMGSNISSEIGSMRITDQIDAMDMMGVNSAGFLVLPKIVSATLLSPLLMLLSLAFGILGGWMVVSLTGIIGVPQYIEGIKYCYNGFYVFYSGFKMSLFCFLISSIASFRGYYATGGSLGVGSASTKAIVTISILILLFDLIVTQLMLY
ncbi:MAG: ABC transporter permease [Bacteroidetes bacterium]|uniref:ABC transporter permease n=1 Tax=Candidatus Cryptobacteroides excrementipullorum TaxID=2840761 RepID=A0A9D9IW93_9BACT|nr:ABC transporter permease [Candidatus Cryptobacteroides excrementipullorum]